MLSFYFVDKDYVNYLRKFDSKVPTLDYVTHDKFFCGVVLSIGGIKYYAPISHDITKQRTNFIIYHRDQEISSIKFSFMIPVPDDVVHRMDFNEIEKTDCKYADLLRTEYEYCRAHTSEIYNKAEAVYKIGTNPRHKLNTVCCDYNTLESVYLQYGKQTENNIP